MYFLLIAAQSYVLVVLLKIIVALLLNIAFAHLTNLACLTFPIPRLLSAEKVDLSSPKQLVSAPLKPLTFASTSVGHRAVLIKK